MRTYLNIAPNIYPLVNVSIPDRPGNSHSQSRQFVNKGHNLKQTAIPGKFSPSDTKPLNDNPFPQNQRHKSYPKLQLENITQLKKCPTFSLNVSPSFQSRVQSLFYRSHQRWRYDVCRLEWRPLRLRELIVAQGYNTQLRYSCLVYGRCLVLVRIYLLRMARVYPSSHICLSQF